MKIKIYLMLRYTFLYNLMFINSFEEKKKNLFVISIIVYIYCIN